MTPLGELLVKVLFRALPEAVATVGPRPYQVVAVLFPAVVSAAVVFGLTRPILRCQGSCDVTGHIDATLARVDPELVVVGNSMARQDIDLEILADGLGYRPDRSALLGLAGSSPGSWYAMLRYRVFEKGYRPSLVVVVGASRLLWVTRPVAGSDVTALVRIAGSEEPTVLSVAGLDDPWSRVWQRVDLHRRMWRAEVVEGFGQTARTLQSLAGVPLDERMQDVFAVGGARVGVSNVFGGVARGGDVEVADTVDETYLPALVDLVQSYDARLVVVRVPPRDSSRNSFLETRPEADAELAAWFEGHDVEYLSMEGFEVKRKLWIDSWHLHPEGAVYFTEDVVGRMKAPEAQKRK